MDATTHEPEIYVRINLTKTAKEWRHETTASIRAGAVDDLPGRLADLLADADTVARAEIARRERLDADGKEDTAPAA